MTVTRPCFFLPGLALAGFLWGGAGATGQAAEPVRPNLVVLLADDLGYADLGWTGGRDIPTPALDALARSGVICTNGYVSGPYCSPTRAGLLTGRYQQRFGHEFNPGGEEARAGFGLPLSETTLANRLKAAGYTTGLIGKWHLGAGPEFQPRRRGFDEFYGFLPGSHSYVPAENARIFRGEQPVEAPAYLTDALGQEAVAFIDRNRDRPFFLYLAFNAVHTPMQAPEDRRNAFAHIADPQRRTYAAMLSALDDAVGAVLEKLRMAGLEENTLIFFLSDNGGPTMAGTTINGSRNDPFRGSKRTTLEGGIRVPFVVRWKGQLPEGGRFERPVIQLDILPTALAAAGVPPSTTANVDGTDLLPYLQGRNSEAPHEALFWRLGEQMAVRRGDWKLVRYDATVDQPGTRSNVSAGIPVSSLRLYNLASDPGEAHDLAAAQPDTVAKLEAAWQSWNAQLAPPRWGPRVRVR